MSHFERRIEVVKAPKKDPGGIFESRKLKEHEDYYWLLDPMPSKIDLEQYYRNEYWNHRTDSAFITERDVTHFDLLLNSIPNFFSKRRKIMNFGAGRGGISFLFKIAGHEVINIEPSSHMNQPGFGITSFSNIEDYSQNDIDLVYGSHSLEHVHDIHEVLESINARLKPISFSFWEVPNALAPNSGPLESKIFVPHTYYFKKEFFDLNYRSSIISKVGTDVPSASQTSSLGIQFKESKDGDVIRFLGSGYLNPK